jgi:hypothetical protein
MSKTAAALAGTIVVVAAATGLLLSRARRPSPTADTPGPSSPSPSPSTSPSPSAPASPSPSDTVTRLALARAPAARLELISLYVAWAKDPARNNDRRVLIEKVATQEEPMAAVGVLTAAATGDPTPLEADALIADMARALAPVWRNDRTFAEGRDLLRLAEHDKARALLAATLTLRAADHPPGALPPLSAGERQELASDLIQINMHTGNRALKAQTLDNVRTIAGPAVAEVLADPARAATSLAARNAEAANATARRLMRTSAP